MKAIIFVFVTTEDDDEDMGHGTLNSERDTDAKVEAVEYYGLMLPAGGALSNLTTLHIPVAQHYAKRRMTIKGTNILMGDVSRRSNVEEEQ